MPAPYRIPGTVADTLSWLPDSEIEFSALDQIRNVSKLPWVDRIRIMPDVHMGSGATIGSVIAMRDAISPSAVGVDIGCGMTGIRTNLTAKDLPEDLHTIRLEIEKHVPVGNGPHGQNKGVAEVVRHNPQLKNRFNAMDQRYGLLRADNIQDIKDRAFAQCGSLGGGNHFIEVCLDTEGAVWLMLHSGSRNIGKSIAERHIAKAKVLEHNVNIPDKNLSVFLKGTTFMDAYLYDLWWAQDYALLSRDIMMATVFGVMRTFFPRIQVLDEIKCHHNYVAIERLHDGTELIVTRKGAISAHKGQLGLIPGSMGTGSYVVKGTGNETGLFSASHGAGRKMARNAAKRTFTVDDLKKQTAGVECRKDAGVVDEIPGAYKDLNYVIDAQATGPEPLIEPIARLNTILCVKG